MNSFDDNELFGTKNLISIVFALDKKSDTNRLIRTFERTVKIFSSHDRKAQIDLTDWLKDVLVKKYPGRNQEVSYLVQLFSKGEGDNMTYAIERLFDEIEEKGMEKGIAKGMEKGMEKGMAMIIERMLKKGKSENEISDDTGLSLVQVISLKEHFSQNN